MEYDRHGAAPTIEAMIPEYVMFYRVSNHIIYRILSDTNHIFTVRILRWFEMRMVYWLR